MVKENTGVLVFEGQGRVMWVSGTEDHHIAKWDYGEKPALYSKKIADEIAIGLCLNGTAAVAVAIPEYLNFENPQKSEPILFEFLKQFLQTNNWKEHITRDRARSVFTAICLKDGIVADSAQCKDMLQDLYVNYGVQSVGADREAFNVFMTEYIF